MLWLLTISLLINVTFIGERFIKSRQPKPKPEVSKIIQQIVDSLINDAGWYYIPAKTTKDKKTASGWNNSKLDLFFTLDPTAKCNSPHVYRWINDSIELIHAILPHEVELIESSIKDREFSKLMSKRIELLDEEINKSTQAEVDLEENESQKVSRKKK